MWSHLPCYSRSFKLNLALTYSSRPNVFLFTSISRSVKLNFVYTWSLTLNIFDLSCYSWCQTQFFIILQFWMYFMFCSSRCLKPHFAYFCSLSVDLNYLPYHCACIKLNFVHTSSLRLETFRLPCHSPIKLNFVHACSLRMDVFPVTAFQGVLSSILQTPPE